MGQGTSDSANALVTQYTEQFGNLDPQTRSFYRSPLTEDVQKRVDWLDRNVPPDVLLACRNPEQHPLPDEDGIHLRHWLQSGIYLPHEETVAPGEVVEPLPTYNPYDMAHGWFQRHFLDGPTLTQCTGERASRPFACRRPWQAYGKRDLSC